MKTIDNLQLVCNNIADFKTIDEKSRVESVEFFEFKYLKLN